MSVSFRILKSRSMVYVRYQGRVDIRESMELFGEYARHPDCQPGQRQFIDLSEVTEIERDYTAIMEMQAMKTDVFMAGGAQPIIIYYTPTDFSRSMAGLIVKSWEPFSAVVPLIIEDEAEALNILGLKEKSISQLLTASA